MQRHNHRPRKNQKTRRKDKLKGSSSHRYEGPTEDVRYVFEQLGAVKKQEPRPRVTMSLFGLELDVLLDYPFTLAPLTPRPKPYRQLPRHAPRMLGK